jgi:hypothetical protein
MRLKQSQLSEHGVNFFDGHPMLDHTGWLALQTVGLVLEHPRADHVEKL